MHTPSWGPWDPEMSVKVSSTPGGRGGGDTNADSWPWATAEVIGSSPPPTILSMSWRSEQREWRQKEVSRLRTPSPPLRGCTRDSQCKAKGRGGSGNETGAQPFDQSRGQGRRPDGTAYQGHARERPNVSSQKLHDPGTKEEPLKGFTGTINWVRVMTPDGPSRRRKGSPGKPWSRRSGLAPFAVPSPWSSVCSKTNLVP